jgi:hypothetical protein
MGREVGEKVEGKGRLFGKRRLFGRIRVRTCGEEGGVLIPYCFGIEVDSSSTILTVQSSS